MSHFNPGPGFRGQGLVTCGMDILVNAHLRVSVGLSSELWDKLFKIMIIRPTGEEIIEREKYLIYIFFSLSSHRNNTRGK